MATISQIAGFAGTALVAAAYMPQILHLIKERCSGGVSEAAFLLWFLASALLLVHAVIIHDIVFSVLQGINAAFNSLVLIYAHLFERGVCPIHSSASR